jgi:hypothetical protein
MMTPPTRSGVNEPPTIGVSPDEPIDARRRDGIPFPSQQSTGRLASRSVLRGTVPVRCRAGRRVNDSLSIVLLLR